VAGRSSDVVDETSGDADVPYVRRVVRRVNVIVRRHDSVADLTIDLTAIGHQLLLVAKCINLSVLYFILVQVFIHSNTAHAAADSPVKFYILL